eukprot:6466079-Amphidinium_carterae.2
MPKLDAVEGKLQGVISAVDNLKKQVDVHDKRLDDVEAELSRLRREREQDVWSGPTNVPSRTKPFSSKSRDTIVIGSWSQDTRKTVIEKHLAAILHGVTGIVDIEGHVELCSWSQRGKAEAQRAGVLVLWFSVDKPLEQRKLSKQVARAAKLLRESEAETGKNRDVDCDWDFGRVWLDDQRILDRVRGTFTVVDSAWDSLAIALNKEDFLKEVNSAADT